MIHILPIILGIFLTLLFPLPLEEEDVDMYESREAIEVLPEPTPEEHLLENMTLEEKVGQLFIFGFDGTKLSQETKSFLEKYKIGGVLLLKKNISTETQTRELIEEIQSTNDIPLFISIDQEGGDVARIRWDNTITKGQPYIDTADEAHKDAIAKGEYLKSLGINMNFAPVVEHITDPNSFIYNRAYRGDLEKVQSKSISAIKGYQKTEIISVPKHFPGHSNTATDSHYSLPVVNINGNQWEQYIQPFSSVLAGIEVDAMMIGHVMFPNIDGNYPTTLSEEIIGNRLINELEYKGLIITDDMEMGAMDDIDTPTKLAKLALESGNDILIYSKYMNRHPDIQKDVYEYIRNEVEEGNMDIDSKVIKILRTKLKYNILSIE
jgi:beta-N-acetylhexosaminidase